MAIFYDYIKGINAHQEGQQTAITKINFNANARPTIEIEGKNYGSIITEGQAGETTTQTINTSLQIKGNIEVEGSNGQNQVDNENSEIEGNLKVTGTVSIGSLTTNNNATITLGKTDDTTAINNIVCDEIQTPILKIGSETSQLTITPTSITTTAEEGLRLEVSSITFK